MKKREKLNKLIYLKQRKTVYVNLKPKDIIRLDNIVTINKNRDKNNKNK